MAALEETSAASTPAPPLAEAGEHGIWGSLRVKTVQDKLRNLVSKEKRRYKDENYDLDLTYITDKIIAMGFPASDFEASYRNDADDVYSFFESKHKDHYKFYNLCSERDYPPERYHGRVAHYPFNDHNPPSLAMMRPFCVDLDEWLMADERNVAAIHCKAGKGRTGVMITAYLLWIRDWQDAEDAMKFYGFARTNNQKGITIPSQRRFIYYWHQMLLDTNHYEDGEDEDGESLRGSIMARRSSAFTGVDMDVLKQAVETVMPELDEGEEHDSESDPDADAELEAEAKAEAELEAERAIARELKVGVLRQQLDDLGVTSAGMVEKSEMVDALARAKVDARNEAHREAATAAAAGTSAPVKPPKPSKSARSGAAAEAEEDEEEDEEEEDEDAGEAEEGFMDGLKSGLKKMGFSSRKKVSMHKLADVCTPHATQPQIPRDWADELRRTPEVRGAVPAERPKVITSVRMRTTPKGGYEPNFKIFCGGTCYKSSDMIPKVEYKNEDLIVLDIPDCPVVDETLVVFYTKGALGKKKKMLSFWFHTSFVGEDGVLVVDKKNMDKAVKDKKHKKYDADFKVEVHLKDAEEGENWQDPRPSRHDKM